MLSMAAKSFQWESWGIGSLPGRFQTAVGLSGSAILFIGRRPAGESRGPHRCHFLGESTEQAPQKITANIRKKTRCRHREPLDWINLTKVAIGVANRSSEKVLGALVRPRWPIVVSLH